MFADKLDFLMKLTDTGNSTLGRAISFDSSYISKIRRGVRRPPHGDEFTDSVCVYFVRKLTDESRRQKLSDMGIDLPSDPDRLFSDLKRGLTDDSDDNFMFAADLSGRTKILSDQGGEAEYSGSRSQISVFYGNEGKRDAVLLFLSSVLKDKDKVKMLLLYSGEDMEWMYETESFAPKWGAMLAQILAAGITIRIIHTVRRDFNEMTEALRKWLPMYSLGKIEPYYCPKLRDDIYRRSLFVAPGHSALTSTSIGTDTHNMANLLFTDKRTVRAFEEEFKNYFALCKPLMKIYSDDISKEFSPKISSLFGRADRVARMGRSPMGLTVPVKYIKDAPADIRDSFLELSSSFMNCLNSGRTFREVFSLPAEGTVLPVWPGKDLIYDRRLIRDHIGEIISLLERYPNYEVVITAGDSITMEAISGEDDDAFLMNLVPLMYRIREKNLSTAIYEYTDRFPGESRRGTVIGKLRALYDSLL